MTDAVATWREALKDEKHPRHRLAWLLFPEKMKPAVAARCLAEQKDTVVPILLEVLDTLDLYNDDGLGEGYPPIHAVELLGEWQIVEAVPRLLQILAAEEWDTIVYDRSVGALKQIGPPALEHALVFANSALPDAYPALAEVLAAAGPGDARVYDQVQGWFEDFQEDWALPFFAELLLEIDASRAIPYLEAYLKKAKVDKDIRQAVHGIIRDFLDKQQSPDD